MPDSEERLKNLADGLSKLWNQPAIVSDKVAKAQSREAQRARRDAIIAERERLWEESTRLIHSELSKLLPHESLKEYRDGRGRLELELRGMRAQWWRQIDQILPLPPEVPSELSVLLRVGWWAALIVVGVSLLGMLL